MKRKIIIGVVAVALVVVTFLIFNSGSEEEKIEIEVPVERGHFEIVVTTTGELRAENSEKITGPSNLRRVRVYNVKIADLIPEGTIVDSGDWVATLDRTEAENRLKDIEGDLQQSESQFIKTKLDTTLELRNARDELINLKYSMEEMKIVLEQSKFEPPATIRQANISYDKAERSYNQALSNYELKIQQAEAKMVDATGNMAKDERKRDEILSVLDEFTVMAPSPGMVIYEQEWSGAKRKVGSTISAWDPVVATLPDLSSMISKTYVNEIDISKLETGMKVRIGVDAFPEKQYSGELFEIANIGEQLPGSDAKVFEVLIRVNETDSILKPAMTTSNTIMVAAFDDVLFIPLEAIHNNDSLTFVYKSSGFGYVKQIIETGQSNENMIIIDQGITEDDIVSLTVPENAENIELTGWDVYESIKKKELLKKETIKNEDR